MSNEIITDKSSLDFLKKILWERVWDMDKEIAQLQKYKINKIRLIKNIERSGQYINPPIESNVK